MAKLKVKPRPAPSADIYVRVMFNIFLRCVIECFVSQLVLLGFTQKEAHELPNSPLY